MDIKSLYNNYVKRRFFNKLLIIYTVVIMCSLFLLAYIISNNISRTMIQNETRYNNYILDDLCNYFVGKYSSVEKIQSLIYMDSNNMKTISKFLENDFDQWTTDYIRQKVSFDKTVNSFFTLDSNIASISIYKKRNSNLYMYSQNSNIVTDIFKIFEFKYADRISSVMDSSSKFKLLSIYSPVYNNNGNAKVFTFGYKINTVGSIDTSGIVMVDFSIAGINEDLAKRNLNNEINILALNTSGEILYDSSDRYYGSKFPYLDSVIKGDKSLAMNGRAYIVNTKYLSNLDLYVVGLIPMDSILKTTETTKRTTFIIAVLCIVITMLIIFFSTRSINGRIRSIILFIKNLRKGDFSQKIKIGSTSDEIAEIAVCLNQMSDELKSYIERIYVMDIKQKNTELTALQSQINPHFLYNTLEAIRMKAVINNDREVGNMILMLSKIFRRSIKGDKITYIKDEIDYIKLYLEIFKIRLGDRICVNYDIEDDILHYGVLRYTLQPVIENYIIHGFCKDQEQNNIRIKGFKKDNQLCFIVEDNGKGMTQEKLAGLRENLSTFDISNTTSIGLANINERIKLIFGQECGVDVQSREGNGTIVTITIQLKTKEELNNIVQSTAG